MECDFFKLKRVCHEIFDHFFLSWISSFLVSDLIERKKFSFCQKLVEIFAIFGASPVSTTPVRQTTAVSLTPVRITIPVSMTPLRQYIWVFLCLTGVNDTGVEKLHRCQRHRWSNTHRCQWHRCSNIYRYQRHRWGIFCRCQRHRCSNIYRYQWHRWSMFCRCQRQRCSILYRCQRHRRSILLLVMG